MESNVSNITNATYMSSSSRKISPVPSAITFTFGVLGNVLAIIVLIRHSKQHKWKIFYRLVGALAITDLFGILTTSPIAFMVYANNLKWVGGRTTCNYLSVMLIFASMATMFIVGAMAFDRYLAVWHPFFYNANQKKQRVHVALAGLWIVALFIAVLPLVGFGHNERHYPYTWCFFDYLGTHTVDQVYSFFYGTLGLIVIIMSTLFNGSVIYALASGRGNFNVRQGSTRSTRFSTKGRTRRNEVFIIIFLSVILLCFGICWAPLMIRVFINSSKLYVNDFRADFLAIRFAAWNQILDPWIYVLLRKEMLIRFHNCFSKRIGGTTIGNTNFNSTASAKNNSIHGQER